MSSYSVGVWGTEKGEIDGEQNTYISSTTNNFFSATTLNQYVTYSPSSTINVLLLCLYPTAMTPFSSCSLFHIPQASLSSHSPALPFCWSHLLSTYRSLSNSPHITNKCSTYSPAPQSHITHFSSLIILHLF